MDSDRGRIPFRDTSDTTLQVSQTAFVRADLTLFCRHVQTVVLLLSHDSDSENDKYRVAVLGLFRLGQRRCV